MAASICWMGFQSAILQHNVKERIKTSALDGTYEQREIRLAFTHSEAEAELDWEHSSEFEFDDQMYDVMRTEIRSDSVIYWCWWDKEESFLEEQLSELLTELFGHPTKKQAESDWVTKYLSLTYLSPPSRSIPAFQNITSHYRKAATPDLITVFYQPPTPPPKFML